MVRYAALRGFYDVEKTIGCGGFAKVKLATHTATGEKVAIKIMQKSGLGDDLPRVKLELAALKALSHQNICKLYQVLETDTHFFIIIEYCSGGELFDHIVERNKLSETQSRLFFRQIASAVAYLHSLGYAHRDLKPENVLLNADQSLKLIDFGLCAKPEGGMKSPLSTSCGSPTYAAPELVLGHQYLGPEVDVWSMGVLLYALLCGFLPFDDQSIDSLYKKILSGKYHEPPFLSKASKDFIRSMLQVDPKKRITISDLLVHPWMTAGGLMKQVRHRPEAIRLQDEDCISLMAQYHGVTADEMWQNIKKWHYDYNTATYFLLWQRKKRGLPLQLCSNANRVSVRPKLIELQKKLRTNPVNLRSLNNKDTPLKTKHNKLMIDTVCAMMPNGASKAKEEDTNNIADIKIEVFSPGGNFIEPRRPSSIRKPQKRIRSPTFESECSPVPAKKAATPRGSTPCTPEGKRTPASSETPGSARRMLGSIERSFNRVRHVLTPKKSTTEQALSPAVLTSKDLCNVSTTQCSDPEFVINELSKALQNKGIHCERKGFSLRGKMEPNLQRRLGGCSFELEICYLPSLGPPLKFPKPSSNGSTPTKTILKNSNFGTTNSPGSPKIRRNGVRCTRSNFSVSPIVPPVATVGIRRKRLKGDSWCYKKVCEEVLALTATDFRQVVESAV